MKYLNNKTIKNFPYLNRDLSWLSFNERVLEEAENKETPLLEQLRFLCIFTENLDEFFMIRVAGLVKKIQHGQVYCETPDQQEISNLLTQIRNKVLLLQVRQENIFNRLIYKNLKEHGIILKKYESLEKNQKEKMYQYYLNSIYPALTPLNIDASHPFPFLANLINYLLVEFEEGIKQNQTLSIGLIQVPLLLDRLIEIPNEKNEKTRSFLLLEDLVSYFAQNLFPKKVKSKMFIRVTRNLDYSISKKEINDLKESVAEKIITRQNQKAVRLQYTSNNSPMLLLTIKEKLRLDKNQIYLCQEPYEYKGLKEILKLPYPQLKFPYFNPRIPSRLALSENIFKCIQEQDLLVHHPYESFYTIGEFTQTAARDPQTVAIKQTLYRSSGVSPIIDALMEAARNGKDVTVVIELTARFDEQTNIDWSQRLERSGVKVVYGFVGLKTHCKLSLVLRKENGKIIKYSHLSTGNYNPQTAKLYTDIGLLTKNENIGNDLIKIFNILTGLNGSTFTNKESLLKINLPQFEHLIVSPFFMRQQLIHYIRETEKSSTPKEPSLIIIKINALVDPTIIKELYEASNRGVKIHLIVRGSCCLQPGLEKFSKNIIVTSIVDRFLEHSRIFYFKSHQFDKLLLGSADLMERNLNSRIEVLFPILQTEIKKRIISEILNTYCQDNVKARYLLSDGNYTILPNTKTKTRAQTKFIELARSDGFKSLPYQKAIHHNLQKKGTRPILYEQ